LVLVRLQALGPGRIFTEVEESPNLIAEIAEGSIVTGREIVHPRHIVSRYSGPRPFARVESRRGDLGNLLEMAVVDDVEGGHRREVVASPVPAHRIAIRQTLVRAPADGVDHAGAIRAAGAGAAGVGDGTEQQAGRVVGVQGVVADRAVAGGVAGGEVYRAQHA